MQTTGDLVSFYDKDLHLTDFSKALVRQNAHVVAGADIGQLYPDFLNILLRTECRALIDTGLTQLVELRMMSKNAERRFVRVFKAGHGIGLIETGRGAYLGSTAADAERIELVHQASHDELTGLQNRRRFSEHLRNVASRAALSRSKEALLQVDLDEFKNINDTLGHGVGDELLQLAARRIEAQLGPNEAAFRYAGDEFAVIQSGRQQPSSALHLADSLIRVLKEPFTINGISVFIGASVGVAIAPEHGTESDQLMKAADIALYAAKSERRGCAKLFNRSMLLLLEHRENLRRNLRLALARGQFFLEYQPFFEPPSKLVGFEALLRWRHPEIGLIPPSIFVPIAEADGLMDEIGRWILREACHQAITWPKELILSVNLSPAQFLSGKLTDAVAQIMDSVGMQGERVELEITESVLLEKTVDNSDTLSTLNILGIGICLDDFGTAYSSLSYLKNFPFDTLKIDRYFINDLETDPKSQTIVRSIINLAHGLGIRVTAEGVETSAQARWLADCGCDCLQGFYLGRPGDEEATRKLIAAWKLLEQGENIRKERGDGP